MKRELKVARTGDGDYMVIRLSEDNRIEYLKHDWTWGKSKEEARIHFHESDAIGDLMIKRQKGEDVKPKPIIESKEVQSWSDL